MVTRLEFDLLARDRASSTFRKVGNEANSSAGLVGGLGRSLARTFGPAAVGAGLVKTIGLAKDFDLTIRQVGVQTGQTGAELDAMGELAKQMGADTIYSAQEAGGAMLELAKGGLTAAQIKAGALETALTLAAAGGLGLEESAGYVTQALSTFGLTAEEAERVAVALAGGANASTASVDSLGQALSQVGPGARNAGLSLEETVAALAAFDNAGIKGSDAGTSLKTMLARLVPTTDKARAAMESLGLDFVKGNGEFEDLATISGQLNTALKPLPAAQRSVALQTIFGSDATRAATVLMNNGSKGVRDYVAATKDQTAVQDMANAAMSGASGAWENFTGSVETAAIDLGQKLLPTVEDVLNSGTDMIGEVSTWGPAVDESFGWIVDGGRALLPVMRDVGGVVADVAGFFNDLPAPIKEGAAQAALAAVVMPRLAAGVALAGGALSRAGTQAMVYGTQLAGAETRTRMLSGAARSAAGPAGMLALVAGAQAGDTALGGLMTTAGAAATGLAVGGPIGGAVGGLGGLVYTLGTKFSDTRDRARESYAQMSELDPIEEAKKNLGDLAASLDQVTGAYTGATRAAVLQKLELRGTTDIAARYGITTRELVNAAMGQANGFRAITPVIGQYEREIADLGAQQEALKDSTKSYQWVGSADTELRKVMTTEAVKQNAALEKQKKTLQTSLSELRQMPGALREHARETRATAVATQDLTGKLRGIPPRIRSSIEAEGIVPTTRGVARVAASYGMIDKKTIRTLIAASGADSTVRQVQKVIERLDAAGKIKVNPKIDIAASVTTGARAAEQVASQGGARIAAGVTKNANKAKADLPQLQPSVRAATSAATGLASTGGYGIGTALGSGMTAGFAPTAGRLAAQARAAVAGAVAAGRAEGEIRSPSRKTMKIGHELARGLEVGAQKRLQFIKGMGGNIASKLADGIEAGRDRVREALDGLSADVQGKLDALNSITSARDDFAAGFQSFGGSIFDTEAPERGSLTADKMLNYQTAQLEKARQASLAVQRLVGMGLNGALLKELQAKGAAGFDQLIALSKGTPSQIAQANANQVAQAEYLGQGGMVAANSIYGGDIAQAAGDYQLAQWIGQAVAAELQGAQSSLEFQLRGDALVAAEERYARQRGRTNKDKKKQPTRLQVVPVRRR